MKNLFKNISWFKYLAAVAVIGVGAQAAFGAETAEKTPAQVRAEAAAEQLKKLTDDVTAQHFEVLVPVYKAPEVTEAPMAGAVLVLDAAQAATKASPEAAKEAAKIRGNAFVVNVLGHQTRVFDYGLAQATAAEAGDVELTEAIIRDRIADEKIIHEIENPSWMTRLKWWWNS